MAVDPTDPVTLTLAQSAELLPTGPVSTLPTRRERMGELAQALVHSRTFVVGAVIVVFWILDAMLWWVVVPQDPHAVNPADTLSGPSRDHLFGTDDLGRDVFSRVLAGATSVLTVAVAATVLGILGGLVIGLVTGYYRGVVDNVVMRLVEAALAFPLIIFAVLVLAVLGRSVLNVIVVIGIVFAPLVSRTVRSAVLVEREREYVAAAKLRGESGIYVMAAEILPNITGPIAVEATVRLGYAIFTVSTLSFLGLGLQPPSPDWGLAVANGRAFLQIAPWMVLFPALALATLVVAVNLVADGLKQVVAE
jgi:peptide/nickel transport system permease protein